MEGFIIIIIINVVENPKFDIYVHDQTSWIP